MADSGSVVLYRSGRPYWLVDAKLDPETGLAVCSGDNNAEWYLRVMPENLPAMATALRDRLDRLGGSPILHGTLHDLPDNELLLLLLENFGNRDSNPFDAIKAFVSEAGVPAEFDHFGSM
ncbi:MAG: hypothetical protein R3176_02500 [Woeseiaceae bacterium]|nr:hypothetical protein [Woeseiaceae bacterium]